MSVTELRQFAERHAPSVLCAQHRCFDLIAACKQMNHNAIRTVAVSVVKVIPDLHDLDIRGLFLFFGLLRRDQDIELFLNHKPSGLPGVRDHESLCRAAGDLRRIAIGDAGLGHRVADFAGCTVPVHILAQVFPDILPAIVVAQHHGLAVGQAVGKQLHADLFGMISVAHPDLFHADLRLFRQPHVGQCGQRSVSFRLGQLITRHARFCPGILDLRDAVRQVFWQIIDPIDPVGLRGQLRNLSGILAICQQFDRQSLRPQAVPVLVVLPDLLYCGARHQHIILHQKDIFIFLIACCQRSPHFSLFQILADLSVLRAHISIFVDFKMGICRQRVSLRCHRLAQRIFHAGFKALYLMRLSGH